MLLRFVLLVTCSHAVLGSVFESLGLQTQENDVMAEYVKESCTYFVCVTAIDSCFAHFFALPCCCCYCCCVRLIVLYNLQINAGS